MAAACYLIVLCRRASGTVRACVLSLDDRSIGCRCRSFGRRTRGTDGRGRTRRTTAFGARWSPRPTERKGHVSFLPPEFRVEGSEIRPNPIKPPRGMAAAKTRVLVLMVFGLINELLDTKFDQDDKFHPATSCLTLPSIPPILAERPQTQKNSLRNESEVRLT